ncbi:hypothetical protein [Pseudomonas aeruginosa]|uniref:hypothetical protein n=1 Tax=Pseudomonas aeruginosa TaxID=287 RepID=UPI0037B45A26
MTDAGATLNSTGFDNSRAGLVSAKGAVAIRTGALNNSQKGSIGGNTACHPGRRVGRQRPEGRISTKGTLDANLKGLLQQGSLAGRRRGVTLDLNGGTPGQPRPRSGFNAWRAPAAPTRHGGQQRRRREIQRPCFYPAPPTH